MKIYTSYYSNRKIANLTKFAISRSVPRDLIEHYKLALLAPSADLLYGHKNGYVSNEEYVQRYVHYLNSHREEIIDLIRGVWRISKQNGTDAVLLCWEGKTKFCHRHLFAKWFFEQTGYQIEEL